MFPSSAESGAGPVCRRENPDPGLEAHRTISLCTALNAHIGRVRDQCCRHHCAVEFRKFFDTLKAEGCIHLRNYAT